MNEVTRSLHLIIGQGRLIRIGLIGHNISLIGNGQYRCKILILVKRRSPVNILGINIAATFACGYIQQVELYYACDRTVSLVSISIYALHNFEEDTRGQCNLIERGTVVAVIGCNLCFFPFVIGRRSISGVIGLVTFSGTYRVELHVGGDTAEQFHYIIDAKVTSMFYPVQVVLIK